jgi:hypothetical protein
VQKRSERYPSTGKTKSRDKQIFSFGDREGFLYKAHKKNTAHKNKEDSLENSASR